jgi:hypothetical protein
VPITTAMARVNQKLTAQGKYFSNEDLLGERPLFTDYNITPDVRFLYIWSQYLDIPNDYEIRGPKENFENILLSSNDHDHNSKSSSESEDEM